MNEQVKEISSDCASLLLQATDPSHSAECRIALLDEVSKTIADYRETLVRRLVGLEGCGDAPPDV